MEHAILLLRGHKVLMDTDLARLYGVETRTLRSGRPFWQRGYYEHVIRSESSLNRLRMYIADNPARWAFDRENPEAI